MSRRETAEAAFLEGYNCAQSVVKAFTDLLPVDEKTALAMASSFGGGMGRLREVCGAVSGMSIVLGFLKGYSTPETGEIKAEHYKRIQEAAKEFEAESGSIVCRELLGLTVKHDVPVPEARTEAYYRERPCKKLIGNAAEILEKYLENN